MIRQWFVVALATLAACTHAAATTNACRATDVRAGARWSIELDGSPAAVAVDATGAVVTRSDDAVVAVDRAGRHRWHSHVAGAGLDWPVIDGDLVVVPTATLDDRVGCSVLERISGRLRYAVPVGAGIGGVAGVGAGVVVCASSDGHLVAIDRSTGHVRWSIDPAAALGGVAEISARGALVVDDATGRLAIVVGTNATWMLTCWNITTGAHEPGCDVDLGASEPPSAVVAAGPGEVLVGSGAGRSVLIVDLRSGRVRATIPVAEPFDPANIPLVTGRRAVVVDRLGGVTAVDLRSGTAQWRAALGQVVLDAKPSVAAGIVHLVDWTGRIHRLRLTDGRAAGRVDETGGAIAAVADPAGTTVVTLRRGLAGDRLEGSDGGSLGPESPETRPLQCRAEPGHSTRNDARP